jgi:PEP-CTERM motif
MRPSFLLSTLLFLLVLGPLSSASADTVTLTDSGNIQWNGYAAGPYGANLNGNSISMLCLSFDRQVSLGQTWDVAVNQLTATGVANSLYGGLSDALARYQQAAWLYDQIRLNPSDQGDIQGAIWNLFSPGAPDTLGSASWLSQAQAQNFAGYDFSRFRILTPLDRSADGPQENLMVVPEPASMLLLGTGLLGIAGYFRRRRQEEGV